MWQSLIHSLGALQGDVVYSLAAAMRAGGTGSTMSSGGDALRLARRQLPRIRSNCVSQAMAAPK